MLGGRGGTMWCGVDCSVAWRHAPATVYRDACVNAKRAPVLLSFWFGPSVSSRALSSSGDTRVRRTVPSAPSLVLVDAGRTKWASPSANGSYFSSKSAIARHDREEIRDGRRPSTKGTAIRVAVRIGFSKPISPRICCMQIWVALLACPPCLPPRKSKWRPPLRPLLRRRGSGWRTGRWIAWTSASAARSSAWSCRNGRRP